MMDPNEQGENNWTVRNEKKMEKKKEKKTDDVDYTKEGQYDTAVEYAKGRHELKSYPTSQ